MTISFKKEGKSLLPQKTFFAILCILILSLGINAYGEVDSCKVGDETTGYWNQIGSECRFPGPPAEGSPWPTDPDFWDPYGSGGGYLQSGPFSISGRYKIITTVRATSNHIPPKPECITGLLEAWTKSIQNHLQNDCNSRPICGIIFKAEGARATNIYLSPPWTFYKETHRTHYESQFILYEWVCFGIPFEPPEKNNNQGPPCPPGQCCE